MMSKNLGCIRILRSFILLCIFCIFIINKESFAYNTGNDYNPTVAGYTEYGSYSTYRFYIGQCTDFVAWCLNTRNGVNFTNSYGGGSVWGNAKNWGAKARSLGITVDSNPAVGSIAWWETGTYGHVAWVSSVNGGNVKIEEYYGSSGCIFNSRTISASDVSGFIHIKDLVPLQLLDVNFFLDGVDKVSCDGYGTIDVYIGGSLKAKGVTDYCAEWPEGTSYKIVVHTSSGHSLEDVDGALEGKVGSQRTNVWLKLVTLQLLDVNFFLDGVDKVSCDGYGTIDVYIGGSLKAKGVTDYCAEWPEGTNYKIVVHTSSGHSLEDVDGALEGKVGSKRTNVWLKFSTDIERGSEMIKGYNREIPDGDYMIACAADILYRLDIKGTESPAANGTNVNIAGPYSGDLPAYEIWTLKYSDGFYTISQKDSNAFLTVCDGDTLRGKNVEVQGFNSKYNQKWAISKSSFGKGYRIDAKCSGYTLDIENGDIVHTANVRQWAADDPYVQAWVFIPYKPPKTIDDGRYIITSILDGSYEIDIPGNTGDLSDKTSVQIWSDTAPSEYNSFDVEYIGNGYYRLTHSASGKCLEVYGEGKKSVINVDLSTGDGTAAQQWAIISNGEGYTLVTRCSGMVLDVNKAPLSDGVNVITNYYNGGKSQKWEFKKAEYTVTYNANGGSDTPASQTKYYKSDLTISHTRPKRDGYNFIGWAKTNNAVEADYLSGGNLTEDEDMILYAVWEKNSENPTNTEISEIICEGNTVRVSVSNPQSGIIIYCAGYDVKGKLMSVRTQFLAAGQKEYYFYNFKNSKIKVFVLDKNGKPVCRSRQN